MGCCCFNLTTGGPSSSCEMIIVHNNSPSEIIRVCMRIFTTALRNKTIRQILNKNTSPYFHSVSLVIWSLSLMKRTHLRKLSISRFSTYVKFSIKIPHFTFTEYHLLSDRFLWWKELILGFSYVRWEPRNGQLAKMGSFHQSKRSEYSKLCTVEVRWVIFMENLTYCFIPLSGRKYSHTNSYNSAMTVIVQDDHLTAGAWTACDLT